MDSIYVCLIDRERCSQIFFGKRFRVGYFKGPGGLASSKFYRFTIPLYPFTSSHISTRDRSVLSFFFKSGNSVILQSCLPAESTVPIN